MTRPSATARRAAGPGFEDSRVEGQLETIPAGAQCTLDGRSLRQTDLSRMTAVTHDRDVAFTVLYDRLVETGLAKISADRVPQAIQAIVDGVFGGSRPAYNAALAKAGANIYVARAAIADELLRAQVEGSLQVPARPTRRSASSTAPTRTLDPAVQGPPAAPWLGNRRAGFALAVVGPGSALPAAVCDRVAVHHRPRLVHRHAARPGAAARRAPARPGAAGDPHDARLVRRTQAYEDAARKRAESALNRTTCLRDDLPNPAVVSVSTYLPFLALSS